MKILCRVAKNDEKTQWLMICVPQVVAYHLLGYDVTVAFPARDRWHAED